MLACVLLIAQTLGMMHRVLHSPLAKQPGALVQMRVDGGVPAPVASVFAKLFSGHQDDSDCRVFDQLSHGDAFAAPPLLAVPLLACAFLLPFFHGEALRRWAALFDARGPPCVR